MPQNDRHRTRVVPIEFNANERFDSFPLQGRVSIVMISSGKASLSLNENAVTLTAPCVMLVSPYDTIQLLETTRLAAKSFSFHPCFLNSALTFDRIKANDFFELEDEHDRNMMNLFLARDAYYDGTIDLPANTYLRLSEWLAIIGTEVFAQSDGYWTCRIRRYLLQTLYLLDDIYMKRNLPHIVKREKSFVDILLEYIHVNYSSDISLDALCALVHLNRTSLNRKFKEQVGSTAMEYLLKFRLKIACEALTHTNLSLAEIAEAIGFRYDTYFVKQFKSKIGQTPTEYRQCFWEEKDNRLAKKVE
ncbi:MAG: helix-turn-helix transcriptional regulator [Paenibacillaceae bacterium]|nr:helix-turn-helix transcriptional regulator [Paenibacillaceae bacterium]